MEEAPTRPAAPADRPKKTVQPNMMSYTDDKGIVRQIHLPTGLYQKAVDHLTKNEYDELAKFPKWEYQKYTEADYEYGAKKAAESKESTES